MLFAIAQQLIQLELFIVSKTRLIFYDSQWQEEASAQIHKLVRFLSLT